MDRLSRSPPEPRLSAIVVAAGLSRRMGDRNKLLLAFGGVPLVRRSVETVLRHPFAEVVVVTGHESARVEGALDALPVRIVFNSDYGEGQMTSVRAGLAALEEPTLGVMVCLSDPPWLTTADVTTIAQAFLARPGCAVLVPTFEGARGNPVVLARASLTDILGRGGSFGCKQFISKNADIVTPLGHAKRSHSGRRRSPRGLRRFSRAGRARRERSMTRLPIARGDVPSAGERARRCASFASPRSQSSSGCSRDRPPYKRLRRAACCSWPPRPDRLC